jgi:hypothetical protein
MPVLLTLDEALVRGEILATDTTESTHVIRAGEWVYKFLKPFRLADAARREAYVRQLHFRSHVSRTWPEFNSVLFSERRWLVVSRFVVGRQATFDECRELYRCLRQSGRAYIQDVGQHNVRVREGRLIAIDFLIAEHHPDWLAARSMFVSNPVETELCH